MFKVRAASSWIVVGCFKMFTAQHTKRINFVWYPCAFWSMLSIPHEPLPIRWARYLSWRITVGWLLSEDSTIQNGSRETPIWAPEDWNVSPRTVAQVVVTLPKMPEAELFFDWPSTLVSFTRVLVKKVGEKHISDGLEEASSMFHGSQVEFLCCFFPSAMRLPRPNNSHRLRHWSWIWISNDLTNVLRFCFKEMIWNY